MKQQYGTKRFRHPWDRGGWAQRAATSFFKPMLTRTFWLRHSEPFNKRRAGMLRRAQRRFVVSSDMEYMQ